MNGDPLDELDEAFAEVKRLREEIATIRMTAEERRALRDAVRLLATFTNSFRLADASTLCRVLEKHGGT